MDRKGISDLIATVLIIGFTVALAAIIITWGGRFISDVQEDVDTSTDTGLACSKLNFEITNPTCGTGAADLKFWLSSEADQEIADLIVRTTDGLDNVNVFEEYPSTPPSPLLTTPLEGFGSRQITVLDDVDGIRSIEVIAEIQVGNVIEACQAGIEEFTVINDPNSANTADCYDAN